jgi:hypothetical protein
VCCGHFHSAALTDDGRVFTWGDGSFGQLGHNNKITVESPKLVEALAAETITKVRATQTYMAALTSSGVLYTWGKGPNGQLGHGAVMAGGGGLGPAQSVAGGAVPKGVEDGSKTPKRVLVRGTAVLPPRYRRSVWSYRIASVLSLGWWPRNGVHIQHVAARRTMYAAPATAGVGSSSLLWPVTGA